jgi:hypothetical protein
MVAPLSLLTHMGDVAALAVVFVVCAALGEGISLGEQFAHGLPAGWPLVVL